MSRHRSTVAAVLLLLPAIAWSPSCRGSGAKDPHPAPPAVTQDTIHSNAPTPMPSPTQPAATSTATLAAGCFWCIEAVLERVPGILDVQSGYIGGTVDSPTYEQVCSGATGHAEAVQVTFDPKVISYRQLLDWFFQAHDPTTKNRQGNDYGTQYRSAIFVHDDAQREEAKAATAAWQDHYQNRIVTEITAATKFWPAEEYHQDYFAQHPDQPYCRAMIPPKLKKLGLDKQPQK